MFDPTKLVTPFDTVVKATNERVRKLLIDESNTVVNSIESHTGYFNTRALVDNVDSDGVVVRADREILYNRVDIGDFVNGVAIETNDIYDVPNKNIITDYVTQTNTNPSVDDLVTLFNNEYNLPVEANDLTMVPRTQVTGRDTSFGRVYKDINCKITTGSVMHSGGNIVVHQRTDTHPFSYNKIATSKPGFMVYREWDHGEILELTLPDIESVAQSGWEIMFEDVKSTQQLGNGDLWFKIKHDTSASKWIYESISGTRMEIDATSLVKVKVSAIDGMLNVECLSLVNNNAYESIGVDDAVKLTHTRGLQRVTAHSINPNPTLFNLKAKLTQSEALNTEDLITNDKSYDYTYNQLQASPSTNALTGLVDKNIVITNYNVVNYAETVDPNSFIAVSPSKRGTIQSFDKFNTEKGHVITFTAPDLIDGFTTGSIISASIEYIDRVNSNNSIRVLLKNPKVTEGGLTLSAECYEYGQLNEVKEVTLSAERPLSVGCIFEHGALSVVLSGEDISTIQATDEQETHKYISTLTIVPATEGVLPIVDVTKSNAVSDK